MQCDTVHPVNARLTCSNPICSLTLIQFFSPWTFLMYSAMFCKMRPYIVWDKADRLNTGEEWNHRQYTRQYSCTVQVQVLFGIIGSMKMSSLLSNCECTTAFSFEFTTRSLKNMRLRRRPWGLLNRLVRNYIMSLN